jgi:predicted nucleotidyltransferase component of viral defense system
MFLHDRVHSVLQEEIRKLILRAICSDDSLFDTLVLKGGNALSIVYGVGDRSSLDLDFSMKGDVKETSATAALVLKRIEETFNRVDICVFDYSFEAKPRQARDSWWGGYVATFKLIARSDADRLENDMDQMRRQAISIDPGSQKRKYTVEISKYEYVDEIEIRSIDDVRIRVYSPVLLAGEKLRALLQQHPQYPQIPVHMKRSRARDFYDIWNICNHFSIKLDMYRSTIESIFAAKRVDMSLLSRISEVKSLHMATWADVEQSTGHEIEEFEFYFAFVESVALSLYTKWIEDAP